MNSELFFKLCDRYFQFLLEKFGCRVVSRKDNSWRWGYEVTYQNSTTAVKIRYEPADHYVFILLCQLVNGKIPDYPVSIHRKTKLHQFYLDDLLVLRSPGTRIRSKPFGDTIPDDLSAKQIIEACVANPFTKHDLEHMVKTYAAALRKHGADILRGDFTVFAQLEKIVKKRAEERH